ncbi:MAG: hypothetical protein K8S87_11045, partial [Planctomycetes bacterium]|nr:hypothetical protein [Planctomycetota bacterium]
VEIQTRQISKDKQIIPAWFKDASEKLPYPICKEEDDYFIMLVPHDYCPTKATKDSSVYVLLDDILDYPVKVYIAIYFDRNGTCMGIKVFLTNGDRFQHYHSGVSNDWDCLGAIKKINNVSEMYDPENSLGQRFVESLCNGLDIIRIDSVTQNQPVNAEVDFSLPSIDDLEYDSSESIRVWST